MKSKDYLIVALAPLAVLLIPFIGNFTVKGCNWTASDFALMWVLLASTVCIWRFLATRQVANLPYRLAAGLAVGTGLMIVWVTLAVAIIGDDNPANALYLAVILTGLIGTGLARFQPKGMALAAYATAAVTFVVPVVGWFVDPNDFSPGVAQVFTINFAFVLLFALAGLLFRHAAETQGKT